MADDPHLYSDVRPVPAVGCACFRGDDVLLVRRGNAPLAGHWSIPGGRIEPGERAKDAALRELKEETAVDARILGLVDVVDAIFRDRTEALLTRHYVLIDYAAVWTGGEVKAGDDATEARFVPLTGLADYGLWPETKRIIMAAHRMVQTGACI